MQRAHRSMLLAARAVCAQGRIVGGCSPADLCVPSLCSHAAVFLCTCRIWSMLPWFRCVSMRAPLAASLLSCLPPHARAQKPEKQPKQQSQGSESPNESEQQQQQEQKQQQQEKQQQPPSPQQNSKPQPDKSPLPSRSSGASSASARSSKTNGPPPTSILVANAHDVRLVEVHGFSVQHSATPAKALVKAMVFNDHGVPYVAVLSEQCELHVLRVPDLKAVAKLTLRARPSTRCIRKMLWLGRARTNTHSLSHSSKAVPHCSDVGCGRAAAGL